ncbi:MAG: VanZ family protein [Clostridiaceae bacterium]|nr:VanZ family protein [Clostridiaceae bacterium]
MRKKKTVIILLVALIAWVGVIFYFSSQPPAESYSQSKLAIKIILKINDIFDISDTVFYESVSNFVKNNLLFGLGKSANIVVRKSAHFGIYLLLGILTTCLGYAYSRKKLTGFLLGVCFPVTIAVLDEYNQGIVGRSSSLSDVIIDGAGASTGSLIAIIFIILYGILGVIMGKKKHRRF